MSNEVSNADIYNLIVNMKGDLGRVEGKISGMADAFKAHVEDDKVVAAAHLASVATVADEVVKLKLSGAKQRGFVAAISTVGAVLGTGLGALVEYVSRSHGTH
jgi:hypothetical protein